MTPSLVQSYSHSTDKETETQRSGNGNLEDTELESAGLDDVNPATQGLDPNSHPASPSGSSPSWPGAQSQAGCSRLSALGRGQRLGLLARPPTVMDLCRRLPLWHSSLLCSLTRHSHVAVKGPEAGPGGGSRGTWLCTPSLCSQLLSLAQLSGYWRSSILTGPPEPSEAEQMKARPTSPCGERVGQLTPDSEGLCPLTQGSVGSSGFPRASLSRLAGIPALGNLDPGHTCSS